MPSPPLQPGARANGVRVRTDAAQNHPLQQFPHLADEVVENNPQTELPRLSASFANCDSPDEQRHHQLMAHARERLHTTGVRLIRSNAALIEMRDLIQLSYDAIRVTQQQIAQIDRIIARNQSGRNSDPGK